MMDFKGQNGSKQPWKAPRESVFRPDPELVRAAAGLNAEGHSPMVNRTRRAVRIADESRRLQGERGRRQMGITLSVLGAILLLLGPAMWSWIDDLISGEHLTDLSTQVVLLSGVLVLMVAGALIAVWNSRAKQDEFSEDH